MPNLVTKLQVENMFTSAGGDHQYIYELKSLVTYHVTASMVWIHGGRLSLAPIKGSNTIQHCNWLTAHCHFKGCLDLLLP